MYLETTLLGLASPVISLCTRMASPADLLDTVEARLTTSDCRNLSNSCSGNDTNSRLSLKNKTLN